MLPRTEIDPKRPLVAELDYRDPIDLGDPVELASRVRPGSLLVGFCVAGAVRAAAPGRNPVTRR